MAKFFNTKRATHTQVVLAAANAFTFATAFFGMWKHDQYPTIIDDGAKYMFPFSGFCLTAIGFIAAMNWRSKSAGQKQDTSWSEALAQHIIPPVVAGLVDAGVTLTLVNKGPEWLTKSLPPLAFVTAVGGIILADVLKIASHAPGAAKLTALAVFGLVGHIGAELGLVQNMLDSSLPSEFPLAGMVSMATYGTALTALLLSQTSCFKSCMQKLKGAEGKPLLGSLNDDTATYHGGSTPGLGSGIQG